VSRHEFDSFDVAAPLLLQVSRATAAEIAREILDDGVGSVVSDDVVGAVAEELDAAALDEFNGFLVHQVSTTHLPVTTRLQTGNGTINSISKITNKRWKLLIGKKA